MINWILLIISLIYALSVIIGVMLGHLTFGEGLGDIYYLIPVAIHFLYALGMVISKRIRKKEAVKYVFFILSLVIIFSSGLKLTVFRGSEHEWDGNLIINNSVQQNDAKIEKFKDLE